MDLYLIYVESGLSDSAKSQLEVVFPDQHRQIDEKVVIVRAKDVNAKVVATMLGMQESEDPVRLIFKLNGSYSGYYYSDVLAWLSAEDQQVG